MTVAVIQRSAARRRISASRTQTVVLGLLWPFLAAIVDIARYPRWRTLSGFVLFCAFAGWAFVPIGGSDGAVYVDQILDVRLGIPVKISEPLPALLATLVGTFQVDPAFYFAAIGALYGMIVAAAARILFRHAARDRPMRLAMIVFGLAFFLNHPVFSAVAARYHLGLWAMVLATLCAMEERWIAAALLSVLGVATHFGMALFVLALGLLFVTRRLEHWQVWIAYALAAAASILPSSGFTAVGGAIAGLFGGSFGAKVAGSVAYAEMTEFGSNIARNEGTAWFLTWASVPLLYALLLSGHAIWWRIRRHTRDAQCQLWILIILMWAVMMAVSSDPEAHGRIQRNVIALLLLFHARWFLFRTELSRFSLLVNAFPMMLYFIVQYRRWLEQASLVAFLPSIWAIGKDYYPRALEVLFG
ncbi:hypothetical protein ACG3SL_09860 [Sphingomonas sp. CJ20]